MLQAVHKYGHDPYCCTLPTTLVGSCFCLDTGVINASLEDNSNDLPM